MTDDEFDRCMRVLTAHTAKHNLRTTKAGVERSPWYVQAVIYGELATYDGGELTAMVKAAHRERVRLSVRGRSAPHAEGLLEVRLFPRTESGRMYERHPGMEALT